jgi:ribonuclease VapC
MIVVDTSALMAILKNEPETTDFLRAISRDNEPKISALTLYEAMVVCYARGRDPLVDDLRRLLAAGNITMVPFDDQAAEAALEAYRKFGKGLHPAKLGLVDCAGYRLAITLGCPLLYKGDDFAKTDIVPAVPSLSGSAGSTPPIIPGP